MSSTSPRSGLIWVGIAVLCLAGCEVEKTDNPAIASQAEAEGFLKRVPAELKWVEPAEDPAAQERYIKCLRTVQVDPSNINKSYSGGSIASDSAKAEKLRQILRSGPVQVGFDEAMATGGAYVVPVSPSSVSLTLLNSAAASIQAKNISRASEDIKLAFDWTLQTADAGLMDTGPSFGYYNVLHRISAAVPLSQADREKILAALPTEERMKEIQKDQVKQLLEQKIYALAGLNAPRRDLVLRRFSQIGGFAAAGAANPKTAILVPPHGTLDKEATFKALIEMARITILALDSGSENRMGIQRQASIDFVKWLPALPPHLTTATKAERDYVQKKVDIYVEEMNKGENTLGRQFLQSWQSAPMGLRSDVNQVVAELRMKLESLTTYPRSR